MYATQLADEIFLKMLKYFEFMLNNSPASEKL